MVNLKGSLARRIFFWCPAQNMEEYWVPESWVSKFVLNIEQARTAASFLYHLLKEAQFRSFFNLLNWKKTFSLELKKKLK